MTREEQHRTTVQLEAGLPHILAAPRDMGRLVSIVVRPAENERQVLSSVDVSPEEGLAGDRWATANWQKLPDGRPDPESQIALINVRVLELVAPAADAMSLAGDNLIVDLDLSGENLPPGTQLAIGQDVVLEITSLPHTGCRKFARRFGEDAFEFVNSSDGRRHNLRGCYARTLKSGTIRAGDAITRCVPD